MWLPFLEPKSRVVGMDSTIFPKNAPGILAATSSMPPTRRYADRRRRRESIFQTSDIRTTVFLPETAEIRSCGDFDEAFDLCSLCFFCVWRSERADGWLAAISGTYAVPIWPGPGPDARPVTGPEVVTTRKDKLVAGRPWVQVSNVSRPTM